MNIKHKTDVELVYPDCRGEGRCQLHYLVHPDCFEA